MVMQNLLCLKLTIKATEHFSKHCTDLLFAQDKLIQIDALKLK